MNKAKAKFNLIVIVLLTIICLLLGSIISAFISPNRAFALTDSGLGNAVLVGDRKDLWNSETNSINFEVFNDLKQKLFGSQNPLTYINNNKDADEVKLTGGTVVTSRTINKQVGNVENGMIVKLGGLDWMVTSLTKTCDGKEDVVLTLYLANPDPTEKVQFWSSGNNSKGENMYSRSILRQHLLTSDKWSLFASSPFASTYLVQPKNIQYQRVLSPKLRADATQQYHWPNEALETQVNGVNGIWHDTKNPYKAEDVFNDNSGNPQRYDAWADDYIWFPSRIETGTNSNDYSRDHSVWKLSPTQLKFWDGSSSDMDNRVWTRSGRAITYCDMQVLYASGAYTPDTNVTNSLGVRPAIHLNLSEIGKLANPEDLKTTYDGKEHTIKSIAEATKANWYNKDIFENVDGYVNITYTYPDGLTECKNSGDYWVKIELTQKYLDFIDAQVDKEGSDNGWTAEEISRAKEKYKQKFAGEPNTSDTEHPESDTVRWIKITIEKAELDFSNVKWSADEFEYNATNQKVTIVSGLPSCVTELIYSNNSEKNVNADGTFYTASLVGFTCTDSNYKVPTSADLAKIPQLQHDWKITKKQIEVSWTREKVTIGELTLFIPVLQIADNLKSAIEYKYYRNSNLSEEVTLEQIFEENDISQEKPYLVVAKLKSTGDYSIENCVLVYQNATVESMETVFQTGSAINKVEVSLEKNKFTYNGLEQKVTFNVTGGGLTANDLVITYKTADGQDLSVPPINVGTYKVAVALSEGLTDFYIVGQTEFEFEITSLKINKPKENQIQFFNIDGFDLSQVANMPSDWDKYFEIRVFDKDNNEILPQNGNWKFVNANKYKIEIHFKNGVNTGNGGSTDNVIWEDDTKDTFVVTLEIMPLEFVFVGWEDGAGNKRPTLIADEIGEIEKYFNYVIYEIKNNIIIGNELPQNAVLKYNTNYQINLRVKTEFKGNVYLIYNDDKIDETPVHKFKTEINPNPGGGDGSGEGDGSGDGDGNGGSGSGSNSDISSAEKWFGVDGKLSLFAWVLIAIVLILFIFLLLMIILIAKQNKSIKQLQPFHNNPQIITHVIDGGGQATDNSNAKVADTKDKSINPHERSSIVNPYSVSHKDWTFIVKEKDIVNIDLMNSPTDDRVMFYAFKENDLRKLKKFQNQIDAQNNGENMSEDMSKAEDSNTKKKNKKKGKRK